MDRHSTDPSSDALQHLVQQARNAFNSGDWARAEQLCRSVLNARAASIDALNLLAVITARTRRTEEAADLLRRAVTADPDNPSAHNNHGNLLRGLNRCADALDSYQRALNLKPDYAEAYFNRANALQDLGRLEDALQDYQRALEISPGSAQTFNNRGTVLRKLGRFEDALDDYQQALRLRPDYADAYFNRGNVLQQLERFSEALDSYDRALQLAPDAEAYSNRGNTLQALRRFAQALDSYERALQVRPDYADAYFNQGNALQELRRFADALDSYDRGLQLRSDHADAHFNRANALQELGRFAEALHGYDRALQIKPDFAEAYRDRGLALLRLNRLADARDSYERALRIAPDGHWLYGAWLFTTMQLCDWDGYGARAATLIAGIEQKQRVTPPFPALAVTDSPSVQHQAALTWVNELCPPTRAPPPINKRPRDGRVRVGYYSGDYHGHAVAYLTAGLFETHDRERFEVLAFSYGPDAGDDTRKRLAAAFDRFIDVRTRLDSDVARMSRELEIDIAVDLSGFTERARTGIFSHRAAPVQVNWLGYPGTMGAQFIDYIVADATLIPPETRRHYAESVAFLPHTFQVNDRRRLIADRTFTRAELGLPSAGFVFCCFNNSYKIVPAVFDGWMRVLQHTADSVLWLLEDNETACGNLRREAQARGVDAGRLVFAPRMPLPEHLARHRAADLFLDTLPYNAQTTASDALWAGMPVLTRLGESFAARVAASLLNAIGLPELIVTTQEEYEATAIELAGNPARLAEIKEKLHTNRLTTPLFDTELFTRHLEDAYRQMYERYQDDLPPGDIHVAR